MEPLACRHGNGGGGLPPARLGGFRPPAILFPVRWLLFSPFTDQQPRFRKTAIHPRSQSWALPVGPAGSGDHVTAKQRFMTTCSRVTEERGA